MHWAANMQVVAADVVVQTFAKQGIDRRSLIEGTLVGTPKNVVVD
jgi:hypothetical protein